MLKPASPLSVKKTCYKRQKRPNARRTTADHRVVVPSDFILERLNHTTYTHTHIPQELRARELEDMIRTFFQPLPNQHHQMSLTKHGCMSARYRVLLLSWCSRIFPRWRVVRTLDGTGTVLQCCHHHVIGIERSTITNPFKWTGPASLTKARIKGCGREKDGPTDEMTLRGHTKANIGIHLGIDR
jgi:hypothetical protein